MGFPYNSPSWDVVLSEGPMFIGWGSSAPGWYTLIGVIACVVILGIGQYTESKKLRDFS